MPPLPKLLKKKEAYYTPRVINYLLHNHPRTSFALEIKYTDGATLPVSKIAPHQLASLIKIRRSTFHYKIPDMGNRNPFDAFVLYKTPSYVAILFEGGKKLGIMNPERIPSKGSIKQSDCITVTDRF